MSAAVRLPVRQGTPEWLAARRELITATDIPVLLGLSPYRCEADLAADKLSQAPAESTLPMRVGSALQALIGEEYERTTGRRIRAVETLERHTLIPWAAASPDFEAVDEPLLVEAKWTASRNRFADGLPDDVAAQVAWQLMVRDYPAAHVAVLVGADHLLPPFEVERDRAMERDLVEIAADFRERLARGGPFAQSADSLRRRYPADNGTEVSADAALTEAVLALLALRDQRRAMEANEERLEVAIKNRMGEAARLIGPGFHVTWKRTKDAVTIDWKSIADGLLRALPETERGALVGLHSTVREGSRPFRVVMAKED